MGYLIGEFVARQQYEVITTWVDPKYKGLTIAVQVFSHSSFLSLLLLLLTQKYEVIQGYF